MEKYKGLYRIPSARLHFTNYGRNGLYFVTICTADKRYYFGSISGQGIMNLSPIGSYAQQCWSGIPKHFPFVHLGEFVVMPNHIHGILVFRKSETDLKNFTAENKFGNQKQNLASVIGPFKSAVTRYARQKEIPFKWQSRYYDRIIRTPEECDSVKAYIRNNIIHWITDDLNIEHLQQ